MEIKGKHVFITGAAKRLAYHMGKALVERGAKLSAHFHRSKDEAMSLQQTLGSQCQILQADLNNVSQGQQIIEKAVVTFGKIDILIHSASTFYATPLLETTEAQWEDLHGTNLKAGFFLSQAAAPHLSSPSTIIFLADVNASRGLKGYSPYVAAKAGLLMLTKNLARELAPHTRVNSLSPGPVLPPENYTEAKKQKSAESTLLGRWGSPQDITEAAIFLIENDYINGFDLKVDGGRSLK